MLDINLCSVYSLEMRRTNEIDNKFNLNQSINQLNWWSLLVKKLMTHPLLNDEYTIK